MIVLELCRVAIFERGKNIENQNNNRRLILLMKQKDDFRFSFQCIDISEINSKTVIKKYIQAITIQRFVCVCVERNTNEIKIYSCIATNVTIIIVETGFRIESSQKVKH